MEDYNNKTKAELLEIIQNLEKKVEQLSSESVSGRKERFRDRYSNRILDNLPDMLTVLDRDANIVELVSSPSTNHVEGTTADSITQSNIKDILPEDAYKNIRKNMEANDIEFITSECQYQGDCLGTCPKCEAEVRYLEQQLERKRMAGKAITILGISAGLVAMAPMTSCSSSPNKGTNQETISDSTNASVMFGEICPTPVEDTIPMVEKDTVNKQELPELPLRSRDSSSLRSASSPVMWFRNQ